jgi:hypothetical protein
MRSRATRRAQPAIAALLVLFGASAATAQSYRSGVTRSQCIAMGGSQFTPTSSLGAQPEVGSCYIPPRISTPAAPAQGGGNPGSAALGAASGVLGAAIGIMQLEQDRQRRQQEQEREAAHRAAQEAARRAAEARANEERQRQEAEARRAREAAESARRQGTPSPFGGAQARAAAPVAGQRLRVTTVAPVQPRGFCTEVAALARRNAQLARDGDPAHEAAARNYANAHAAYCQRGSAGAPPPRAAEIGASIIGPLGLLAGLADPLRRAVISEAERRAEEARLDRLLADADAELARMQRACAATAQPASASPFGGAPAASSCRPPAPPEQHPRFDSVRRIICREVVFDGPDACIPDETRRARRELIRILREANEDGISLEAAARRALRGSGGYSPHVLSPEDFRRIAAGVPFEEVYEGGMTDRVLADVARRVAQAQSAARAQ